jgi:poly(A) polymerase
MNIELPHLLRCSDKTVYLVGGSVRDLIRGAAPKDYDVVVFGDPRAYAERLANHIKTRVIELGGDRHTVYHLVNSEISIDVTAGKGPDIEQDLLERDFTINAMACSLADGRVVDVTSGLVDLFSGLVRMISPAVFEADPVRLIRAYRLSATLGFRIDAGTAASIARQAALIRQSAGERVWSELRQILTTTGSHGQISAMARSSLLIAIVPQLAQLKGCQQNRHHAHDVLDHTLQALKALDVVMEDPAPHFTAPAVHCIEEMDAGTRAILKLALLLHDVGKPDSRTVDASGRAHFYGHAKQSALLAQVIGRRLTLSNQDRGLLHFLVLNHQRPLSLFLSANRDFGRLPPKALGRFLRQSGSRTPLLLLHALADHLGKGIASGGMGAFIKLLMTAYFERMYAARMPLLNGNDLMEAFGLSPSPLIGELLRRVEQAGLAGTIRDRKEAMDWVSDFLNKHR